MVRELITEKDKTYYLGVTGAGNGSRGPEEGGELERGLPPLGVGGLSGQLAFASSSGSSSNPGYTKPSNGVLDPARKVRSRRRKSTHLARVVGR